MDDHYQSDFAIALGEEFCTVLTPVVGAELCIQDGYEVFTRILGDDFGADALRLLDDSQVKELGSVARELLECPSISDAHLQQVIRRTLRRWSDE